MIKHIVMWNLLESLSADEKKAAALEMKKRIESLKSVIPGVVSLEVVADTVDGSTKDVALFGTYESADALKNYAVHPEHLKVVDYIKTVACGREAFDYPCA